MVPAATHLIDFGFWITRGRKRVVWESGEKDRRSQNKNVRGCTDVIHIKEMNVPNKLETTVLPRIRKVVGRNPKEIHLLPFSASESVP